MYVYIYLYLYIYNIYIYASQDWNMCLLAQEIWEADYSKTNLDTLSTELIVT